jgi:protein involved in polysaccharide export with SLBB domain
MQSVGGSYEVLMLKSLLCACAVGIGLFVSACDSPVQMGTIDNQPQAPQAPRLQAGDKVRITVFGEPSLSGDFEIDPGGNISLPLAGTLQASGLTKAEMEQVLAKKFKSEYLRSPKVTVDIASFHPFYVLGEISHPGEFPYRGGLNVISAIAIAGGETYRASKSRVLIQHLGEMDFKEYPLSPAIPVLPGDTIKLPERYF